MSISDTLPKCFLSFVPSVSYLSNFLTCSFVARFFSNLCASKGTVLNKNMVIET